MKFRYDIGILRGLAVIAVVCYHFQIPFFEGGFAGVDIFFVLSGFLMTAILFKDTSNNQLSALKFYHKRAIRIIPPLMVMTFVLIGAGFLYLLPGDWMNILKNSLASNLFYSNIYYFNHSSYFDTDAQQNFLLHTWSLSVEWQFYLCYPFLFLTAYKYSSSPARLIFYGIILLTIFSFAGMAIRFQHHSSESFYMFPHRAWEMLCGGISFFIQQRLKTKRISTIFRSILAIVFYSTLLTCITSFNDKDIDWPSYYTLLPVVATSGLLCLQVEPRLFKYPAAQFLGNISYSLYLWHWPIIVFSHYYAVKQDAGHITLLIFMALVLSCISYYGIERNKQLQQPKIIYTAIFTGIIWILMTFFYASYSSGKENEINNLSNYNQKYRKAHLTQQFRKGKCHIDVDNFFYQFDKKGCLAFIPHKKNILLIGDSHAGELAEALEDGQKAGNYHFLQATVSTAYPTLKTKGPGESVKLIHYMLSDFIPKNSGKIDQLIIAAHWGSGQYEKNALESKITELLRYLDRQKINYLFIGQSRAYSMEYPKIKALEIKSGKPLEKKYELLKPQLTNDWLKSWIPAARYIDLYTLPFEKYKNHTPYMFDDDHLSQAGAAQLVDYLILHKKI